jgi:type IV pilus assembly protein PilO
MPDLQQTRKKVKTALAALAIVDLITVGLYLSPLVGSQQSRGAQLNQLWRELQQKTREVEPLRGLDKKIPVAHQQIDSFYKDRLPSQESAISEQIGKLAQQSGVRLGSVKYSQKDPESVGVTPLEIEADLSGDYLQLMRFINSLERDQIFFLINTIVLGGEQGGVVKLEIKMNTYLRSGPGTSGPGTA